MDYRLLGRTGVKVSTLAFGTMSLGGDADEAAGRAMFHACRDAGINLFDCADVYSQGLAEQRLGALIRDCRDELVLTSKAGLRTGPDANAIGASRYHLTRACEASLRRLGTDRIDLYFIHRFDEATDLEESLRALETLVQQGKVLYPALSNFAAWQAQKTLGLCALSGLSRPVCVQPMYSLAKRQAEVEILPQAASEGLGVLPYSPLGGGLLSGKYGGAERPDRGRLVDNATYRDRYRDEAHYALAERFRDFAQQMGVHPASLAIAWVARHPAVTAPLIGARNLEQLGPCLAAADVTLDDTTYAQLSELAPSPPSATDRAEEGGAHDLWQR